MPKFVLNGRDHAARELDAFTLGYIEALFFTESSPAFDRDEWFTAERREGSEAGQCDGEIPGDVGFADLHPDSVAAIVADCQDFRDSLPKDHHDRTALDLAYDYGPVEYDESRAGADFWFTRNRHGVGYWDRGLGDAGDKLSTAARTFGGSHVWFGDHVKHGNLQWVYVDGADGDSPSIMSPYEAWGYAATWGSMMTSGDPGACMYGFDESCRPQSEEHRRDVLAWMKDCRANVVASPANYDADELHKLDAFVRHMESAQVEESANG